MRFVELFGSTRSMRLRSDVRAMRSLWRILRTERPDVLHTHNPKPGLYGRVLGRVAGVPLVVHTTHGLYATPDDHLAKRLGVYCLEGVASRFSHVELVQNPEDLELMRRLRTAPRRKLRLLGNGVDLQRFQPADRRTSVAGAGRARHRRRGCGGRARRPAGEGEGACRSSSRPSRRLGAPFRLLLIGPTDPAKADAVDTELLDRAALEGAILTGHRDDVDRLYAAMDIFCLPSHREGFPRAAMEAAASGLPVVATDIRGCRQVVEHGVTGALVPARDVTALADARRGPTPTPPDATSTGGPPEPRPSGTSMSARSWRVCWRPTRADPAVDRRSSGRWVPPASATAPPR